MQEWQPKIYELPPWLHLKPQPQLRAKIKITADAFSYSLFFIPKRLKVIRAYRPQLTPLAITVKQIAVKGDLRRKGQSRPLKEIVIQTDNWRKRNIVKTRD
jgi:hypothetical protein